jgi:hypothetical protein
VLGLLTNREIIHFIENEVFWGVDINFAYRQTQINLRFSRQGRFAMCVTWF